MNFNKLPCVDPIQYSSNPIVILRCYLHQNLEELRNHCLKNCALVSLN